MKRIHITESIRKIARQRRRRAKELAGLHGLVSQVAFGLLLAFYNREKPIQSFDIPLLQLQPAGARARSIAHCAYVGFFACFQAISLERSRFRKIAFLIFMLS